MELTNAAAKHLFQMITRIQAYRIQVIDNHGIILASSIDSRVGSYHQLAHRLLLEANEKPGGTQETSACCLLYDGKRTLGAIELLDMRDGSQLEAVRTIANLVLENEALRRRVPHMSKPADGPLSTLVGVHPLDRAQLARDLQELGFDVNAAHTTLFIQLSKIHTIVVDAGAREVILDERQIQYSMINFLDFLTDYFSGSQDFVMTDPERKNALILYAGREENEDANALRLFHICEYLQSMAEKNYCITMQAVIGIRCHKLADYERQYEQLVKRLSSGRLLFPEKNIFWGHSIVMGSLIFHLSQSNRVRLSSILDNLLSSHQSAMLLETLYAFFECNMNHNKTAEKLFIHRNSLQHRLKKIEELTCVQLNDIDSLLSLRLALLCRSSLLIENERSE